MTQRPDRSTKPASPSPATTNNIPPARPLTPRPLTPRPGLFYALLVIFILWIAACLTMYFTTVYHKTDVHERGATTKTQTEEQ